MTLLRDWLRLVESHWTEPLFSRQATVRLHEVASLLPGDCLSILETRLTPAGGPVDVSLRFFERQARRWTHLAPPLAAWCGGALPRVPSVWLEYDLDRDLEGLPLPVVSARLPAGIDPGGVADAVLPALHAEPLRAVQRALVLACCQAMPPSARLLYAFSLRGRGSDDVRLEIGLDPDCAAPYVRAVAPGHEERVGRLAELLRPVERFHLSFDVGDELRPRFGLEGSFARQPAREPGWTELFDRLGSRGLCTDAQRRAVFAWPGSDSLWTAPDAWPVAAVGARGHFVRSLSHVKLVAQPDRELEAKVYLALAHVGSGG